MFSLFLAPAPALPNLEHPAASSPASPDVTQRGLCLPLKPLAKRQSPMTSWNLSPDRFSCGSPGL